MKFDYAPKETEKGCVAFLDRDDDLWFYCGGVWKCVSGDYLDNGQDEGDAVHKFYPGDKITITF